MYYNRARWPAISGIIEASFDPCHVQNCKCGVDESGGGGFKAGERVGVRSYNAETVAETDEAIPLQGRRHQGKRANDIAWLVYVRRKHVRSTVLSSLFGPLIQALPFSAVSHEQSPSRVEACPRFAFGTAVVHSCFVEGAESSIRRLQCERISTYNHLSPLPCNSDEAWWVTA